MPNLGRCETQKERSTHRQPSCGGRGADRACFIRRRCVSTSQRRCRRKNLPRTTYKARSRSLHRPWFLGLQRTGNAESQTGGENAPPDRLASKLKKDICGVVASNPARDAAQRETHERRIESAVANTRGLDVNNRRVRGIHREETLREAFTRASRAHERGGSFSGSIRRCRKRLRACDCRVHTHARAPARAHSHS